MKSVLICILSCYLSSVDAIRFGRVVPPRVEKLDNVKTDFFEQILDHTASTNRYWKQRYFMNDQFWKGDTAPIFLMVQGESEASPSWLTEGAMFDWASKYGALLYSLEHRFYGQSHPTRTVSTTNLKRYLHSQQALADIAYFIQQINAANNFTSNKWILFGGSYPGNLVAWARLKYPDLVFGSISSSGPLQAKLDFSEYHDVVRDSLNYFSPGCADEVKKAVQSIQDMLTTSRGVKKLSSKIPICDGFDRKNKFDRSNFIESITSFIDSAVQNNVREPDEGINKVCNYMNNKTIADPFDRFVQLRNATSPDCAGGSYSEIVAYYNYTNWNDNIVSQGDRQWLFQTCNEFGYYQTSETKDSIYGDSIPIEFFTQQCTDVFGSEFNPQQLQNAVDATNEYYEGTDIEVQRVVFVQGTIDPWHALGMVNNPTVEDPLYLVTGATHCDDMFSASKNDPPEMKKARRNINRYIKKWLSQ